MVNDINPIVIIVIVFIVSMLTILMELFNLIKHSLVLYFSLSDKKRTKVKFVITAVIIAVIVILLGYPLYRIYVETNIKPYRYWYQLMDKNPKPWNVSFKEFSRRNREGYCWADRKTYTKEELKNKVVASYVEMELLKMKSLKESWVREAGGGYEERSYLGRFFSESDCGKFGCKVMMISPLSIDRSPIFEKAQKLMQGNVQKNIEISEEILFNLYDKNSHYLLNELSKVNSIEIKGDRDFLSYIKNHNDFIIAGIEKSDIVLSLIYNKNIFIISNQDENINQEKFLIYNSGIDEYFPASSIPKNIDIHDYGVGLYYLAPKKIYLYEKDGQEEGKIIKFRIYLDTDIYYAINNCGDLLIKPEYILESRWINNLKEIFGDTKIKLIELINQ
ncbi:hypothetical protein [Stenoxybacter acetivorans]|uniref:hypothetical protein n=1 Tax=Stenoxybacter acetivorans TaxID=422441 RepID=UPI00055EAE44|nr:hypothetical protein [Stenoxybacter acetivorans]